jgi:hypothetical protein
MTRSVCPLTLVIALVCVAPARSQTGAKSLEIMSPANGSVISPGQTLVVALSSPDKSAFLGVSVIGEGNIGSADAVRSLPAQVSLTIPARIELRKYALTAFGVTTGGREVSTMIEIDVERPDMPQSIFGELRQLIFGAEGETGSIDLMARFADGSVLTVRESSKVAYTTSDPGVATVGSTGIVTAIAEGEADITATYGRAAAGISLRIPVSVPAAVLTISPRALDFGNQAVGRTSSQRMTLTNSSDSTVKIVSIAAAGDFTATGNCLAASPLAPGASCTIAVTFTPATEGSRTGTLRIEDDVHIVGVERKLTGTGIRR